ncbi:MAG: hypothetical protein KDC07_03590 [Chitinophagaceae bacterium]|nr:hypothetical protein [Chitinophagaceae bacterium]MCB9044564.1 hypothetical protein [Chitinophagales bacterium]
MKVVYPVLLALMVLTAACVKKPVPVTVDTVPAYSVDVEMTNMVGNSKLSLNDTWYKTANGDSLSITTYAYYMSNFVLTADNGSTFSEPESYHLIDESRESSRKFSIAGVPAGTYTSVTFMIGVDSLRNVSGAQTGDLSTDFNMFWDWNTGYIMAKMEGKIGLNIVDNDLLYHMGGFSGPYSVLRTVTLQFPEPLIVKANTRPAIHMSNNALEWFQTPTTIDIRANRFLGGRDNLVIVADNYMDMFSVEHIDQ